MKKKIIIGVVAFFILIIVSISIYFAISFKPIDKNDTKEIIFNVNMGSSKIDIAKELEDAGLIKDSKTLILYMFFNKNLNLQAGEYSLNKSMDPKEILDKINNGDIRVETLNMKFIEGKRLKDYVKVITENFDYTEEEILELINSKEFLNEMIEKYWFLTDEILNDNIYYGLEGYILPDTYNFISQSSIKDIFITLLNNTEIKLNNFKDKFNDSNLTVHKVLTIASIIEKEANSYSDRQSVSQVIFKRLDMGMSLGMDVTTYYAVQKDMSEELTFKDLNTGNAYNTRNTNMIGLPVGAICNPSVSSIKAVFEPSDTKYVYFYADVKTGKVYFAETASEFYQIQIDLQKNN